MKKEKNKKVFIVYIVIVLVICAVFVYKQLTKEPPNEIVSETSIETEKVNESEISAEHEEEAEDGNPFVEMSTTGYDDDLVEAATRWVKDTQGKDVVTGEDIDKFVASEDFVKYILGEDLIEEEAQTETQTETQKQQAAQASTEKQQEAKAAEKAAENAKDEARRQTGYAYMAGMWIKEDGSRHRYFNGDRYVEFYETDSGNLVIRDGTFELTPAWFESWDDVNVVPRECSLDLYYTEYSFNDQGNIITKIPNQEISSHQGTGQEITFSESGDSYSYNWSEWTFIRVESDDSINQVLELLDLINNSDIDFYEIKHVNAVTIDYITGIPCIGAYGDPSTNKNGLKGCYYIYQSETPGETFNAFCNYFKYIKCKDYTEADNQSENEGVQAFYIPGEYTTVLSVNYMEDSDSIIICRILAGDEWTLPDNVHWAD